MERKGRSDSMSVPTRAKRRRWWGVVRYEVQMFRVMSSLQAAPGIANNLLTEGLILHARNLCAVCLSPNQNDITLRDLFDDFTNGFKYAKLRNLRDRLCRKYGKGRGSARWA